MLQVKPDDKEIVVDILINSSSQRAVYSFMVYWSAAWYTKNGFEIYGELELGYTLYLLRNIKNHFTF